jgi:hypothetical protein
MNLQRCGGIGLEKCGQKALHKKSNAPGCPDLYFVAAAMDLSRRKGDLG